MHAVLSRQSLSCWHSPFWTIENLKGSFVIKTLKDKHLVIPRISFLKYFFLLLLLHRLKGSPSNPGGQEQDALWFCTVQIADGLHGLSTIHGFMQLLSRHAWLVVHSKSEEQPTGSGSPEKLPNEMIRIGIVFLILDFRFKIYCFYIKLKEKRTYFVTVNISLSGKTRNTGTTHSSQRKRAMNRTLCISCAWLNNFARIFTISTETGFSTWTFFVLFTSRIRGRRN